MVYDRCYIMLNFVIIFLLSKRSFTYCLMQYCMYYFYLLNVPDEREYFFKSLLMEFWLKLRKKQYSKFKYKDENEKKMRIFREQNV